MDKPLIERVTSNQQASTLPFIAGIILLVVLITLMSLSMSSISEERTDQQAVADISSLAGANVLARATQHIKIIDYVTWLRNMSQEILYLAATTATIRTGGEARELFAIPQKYEMTTQSAIDRLERSKEKIKEIAPIYAMSASISSIRLNDTNEYYGFSIPFKSDFDLLQPTEKEQELYNKIEIKRVDLKSARQEMADAWVDYYELRAELENKSDIRIIKLRQIAEKKSGRVGGLTSWRNRWTKQLDVLEEERGKYLNVGENGLVAILFHSSTEVPFTSTFGGIETGNNIAMAASRVIDDSENLPFKDASYSLVSDGGAGDGQIFTNEAINIISPKIDSSFDRFGVVGNFIYSVVSSLRIDRPNLLQVKPVLSSIGDVSGSTLNSGFYGFMNNAHDFFSQGSLIDDKYEQKILPEDFEL